MNALIFAAGLGTRLREYTENKPKALVPLAGKPLIQRAIENLKSFGVKHIVINVHHFADQVIDFISQNHSFGIRIDISDERDMLLDTGGGLKNAAHFFDGDEPILIYNVDIISNINLLTLLEFHKQNKALATLVVRRRETSRYLMFDENMLLSGWKNFSSGDTIISRATEFAGSEPLAFSGIHVVQPEIFDFITETGKFPIMDLYLRLAKDHPIKGYLDQSDLWMDLGKPAQLANAEKLFLSK
jgi:Nucleoside-diphosphate-sugar pyrophosphorylase involved in lipopolysaccharide biosynthesis/translation initiation factor 2B, gamma/epsilon subunits (eIF-2Bgamma/eIF-2Bepsilon)